LTEFQFISEDGIKDREWYRHLGVAPGKWLGKHWVSSALVFGNSLALGYGATTLPAITEAITYEKDGQLAKDEANKLASLLQKMAKDLKP
jgi:N-acetylated-alpha-linked acidic dipeptidase